MHEAHRWGVFRCSDGYARTCCRCQWRELADGPTHAEHVADAVIAHLDSRGWLIDPESGDRQRRASNKRWLEGNEDND